MNLAGGELDRAMSPTSYACRTNKGVHKAVNKVQQHLRQYDYYTKIDIDGYFASISHRLLFQDLNRRFKGEECLALLQRIISAYETTPQCGLPIGSLTSQYFANYYLDGLDRLLAKLPSVRAQVRYMDDIIWWCDSKQQALITLNIVNQWMRNYQLNIKDNVQIHPSKQGVSYCGFRILLGTMRLSRRRKRRYQQRRQYWEQRFQQGEIDAGQLQQAYAAVQAITAGTDSLQWRKQNLRLHPPITV